MTVQRQNFTRTSTAGRKARPNTTVTSLTTAADTVVIIRRGFAVHRWKGSHNSVEDQLAFPVWKRVALRAPAYSGLLREKLTFALSQLTRSYRITKRRALGGRTLQGRGHTADRPPTTKWAELVV